MPNLVRDFQVEVDRALALATAGETLRASLVGHVTLGHELTLFRLHLIYEMAYLHIFGHWEAFLEESFLRYRCGYADSGGTQAVAVTTYASSLAAARVAVFGKQDYLLWHRATTVENRSRTHFVGGPHELVIASNRARIEWFAAVRHHIAHKHGDTRSNFDIACMSLCGRRYRGSRSGAFLRDRATISSVPETWLEIIGRELTKLAAQIVP
jgi:hypothetical protein